MSIRSKGKAEIAESKARLEIARIIREAVEAGVDPDDLLFITYGFVTRKTDLQLPAMATKDSVFELRLKKTPQNEEPLAQDELRVGRTPSQGSIDENPIHSSEPVQVASSTPEGNHPCPLSCRKRAVAVILEALFETICPAREGCGEVTRSLEGVQPKACPFCTQSDSCEPRPAATHQESYRECPQTIQSFQKYRRFQFPCSALFAILNLVCPFEQEAGGAA